MEALAEPSRKPTFRQYRVDPVCEGCGRHLKATEPLWFRGYPLPAIVVGYCCWALAAHV
jgi:hypothetical protein